MLPTLPRTFPRTPTFPRTFPRTPMLTRGIEETEDTHLTRGIEETEDTHLTRGIEETHDTPSHLEPVRRLAKPACQRLPTWRIFNSSLH
jgi:hypothetical protein